MPNYLPPMRFRVISTITGNWIAGILTAAKALADRIAFLDEQVATLTTELDKLTLLVSTVIPLRWLMLVSFASHARPSSSRNPLLAGKFE